MQSRPLCRPLTPKETHTAPEMPAPVYAAAGHAVASWMPPPPHAHSLDQASHRSPPRNVVRIISRSPRSLSRSPTATPWCLCDTRQTPQQPQQRRASAYEAALEAYGQKLRSMIRKKKQAEAHHRRDVLNRQREIHKRYNALSRPRSARGSRNRSPPHAGPAAETTGEANKVIAASTATRTVGPTTQLQTMRKLIFGADAPCPPHTCKQVEPTECFKWGEALQPADLCNRSAATQTVEETVRAPPFLLLTAATATATAEAAAAGGGGGGGPLGTDVLWGRAPRPLPRPAGPFEPGAACEGLLFIHPQRKPRPLRRSSGTGEGEFLHLHEPARRSVEKRAYANVVSPYALESFALRHLMRAAWRRWGSRLRERRCARGVFVEDSVSPACHGASLVFDVFGRSLAQPVPLRPRAGFHSFRPRVADAESAVGHCEGNASGSRRSLSSELAAVWAEP